MSVLARYRHPPDVRRALCGLARVVCPPEARTLGLIDAIVDHVELSMRALPAAVRAALVAGLRAYELGAAAVPRHLGRRASRLDPADAEAYYLAWLRGARVQRELAKGAKGLLCLAHYEMPEVQRRMGYTPGEWIEGVRRRRLAVYAGDIRRHEDSLRAPDPLVGPAAPRLPGSRP